MRTTALSGLGLPEESKASSKLFGGRKRWQTNGKTLANTKCQKRKTVNNQCKGHSHANGTSPQAAHKSCLATLKCSKIFGNEQDPLKIC